MGVKAILLAGFLIAITDPAHDSLKYKCYPSKDAVMKIFENPTAKYKMEIISEGILPRPGNLNLKVTVKGSDGSFSGITSNIQGNKNILYFDRPWIGKLATITFELLTDIDRGEWYPEVVTMDGPQWKQDFICKDVSISRSMRVTAYTSNKDYAGTGSRAYITIDGSTGDSNTKRLRGSFYTAGSVATTLISVGDIGRVKGIWLELDDSGWFGPGWHVGKVRIHEKGEALYEFEIYRWMNTRKKYCKITSGMCRTIEFCRSQRCSTCDYCYRRNSTYFYGHESNICFRCLHIENCQEEVCPSTDGQQCSRCDGVVKDVLGFRAYFSDNDRRKCTQACSWRSDSTRCYPGICYDEAAISCACSPGFKGNHCDTISEAPTILWNHIIFTRSSVESVTAPLDPNIITWQEPSWTNLKEILNVSCEFKSHFKQTGTVPERHEFIADYKVGIVGSYINFTFIRGEVSKEVEWYNCPGASPLAPIQTSHECQREYHDIPSLIKVSLMTGDIFRFEYGTQNGGYVKVEHKENRSLGTFFYQGQTTTTTLQMIIDYEAPYHCVETSNCAKNTLTIKNVTEESSILLSWPDWTDDLSDLHHYLVSVYEIAYKTSEGRLGNKKRILSQEFNQSNQEGTISLDETGIFSVELSVYDKAGNSRTTRRIIIYDGESEVTPVDKTHLRVTTAANITSWQWQWTTESVTIDWNSRYINKRHHHNKWLEKAMPVPDVDDLYDDHGYARGIDSIRNIQGIIEYRTAFMIDDAGGSIITIVPGESVFASQELHQSQTIFPVIVDGDTLRFWIRAYDIRREYLEENVTVHIDSSPPVIQNLWLTRGDRLNISVHRIEELSEITIEWESYDEHSGLERVSWKIFDNSTGKEILHGLQHLRPQGDTWTEDACKSKYGKSPRGPRCYCTPAVGCYNKQFHVKPQIVDDSRQHGGLFLSKHSGEHGFEYFIEVTVTNHAQLTTKHQLKIAIDANSLHAGIVYDGQIGQPEIDYKSNLQLHAHWEGFLNKENGVKFYQYGFANHCLNAFDFGTEIPSPEVEETSSTHASWLSPKPGKYYITVVAYSPALHPSPIVCSDGVTVDKSKPTLSQIAILNSHVTEGLVTTQSGEVWLISKDRRRSQILQPDTTCRQKGTLMSVRDLNMVPLHRHANNTDIAHKSSVCRFHDAFALPNVNTFFISKENMLHVNWISEDKESGIHDFELGLMSDASDVADPDILPYISTHHHPKYLGYHPGLSEGQRFYIAVKATNKAGLSHTEVIGPVTVHTQAPVFSGHITVNRTNSTLVARWNSSTFIDMENNYLNFEFAVGSTEGGTELLPFRQVQSGEDCSASSPPLCTAIDITDLHWDLHHSHTYYVSVRVTNIVDMWTVGVSAPYHHNIRRPAPGVVQEVSPEDERHLFDITEFEDSDFQLSKTLLKARWYGFDDGLGRVTYKVCIGTVPGSFDIRAFEDAGTDISHTFLKLELDINKRYYVTVLSTNTAGRTTQSSNGFSVIKNNYHVTDVTVNDGEDSGRDWNEERDYQVSSSSYSGHWNISTELKKHYPEVHWRFEKRVQGSANMWVKVTDYENLGDAVHIARGLVMDSGITYRSAVKFCAVQVCSSPVYSDGVTIINNLPVAGQINVTYTEIEQQSQIKVELQRFHDPDILDETDSYAVMDKYEWSLTDNAHNTKLLTDWTLIDDAILNRDKMTFTVSLSRHLSFVKCRRLALRGYNKAGLYTTISADVKDCSANFIVPAIVIDAVGSRKELSTGNGITLEENSKWPFADVDYSPYNNVLSAVWPSLRHRHYKWAVVSGDNVDPASHYKRENLMTVSEPCLLPDVVRCGETEKEFINIFFDNAEVLSHGKRFYICIHANETTIENEKWTTTLPEVNECSDGITIDLTPPSPGIIHIADLRHGVYRVSKTELSVSWSGFFDVEEYGTSPHPSGISHYSVALGETLIQRTSQTNPITYKRTLGTTPKSEDIMTMNDIGLVKDITLTGRTFHDGQIVYATVQATDFVNNSAKVSSPGFVIDSSPPERTGEPITFEERYATSHLISTCWHGSFADTESGIRYYGVYFGSRSGQADIGSLAKIKDSCTKIDINSKLSDGQSFHVSVKAYNGAKLYSTVTSHSHIVDTSPPTTGHVYDGRLSHSHPNMKDKDYVTSVEQLGAYWEGFSDPHSGIAHFKVKVGTCPGCDDTLEEYKSGSRTDIVFLDGHVSFKEGTKYYVTVTACNMAGSCSFSTSDGVVLDQSPPIQGKVLDGTQDHDVQFQASRTYLGSKWRGFQDLESGIDHYEWRVGTSPGSDDVLSSTYAASEEIMYHTLSKEHQLPVGLKIYSTITAYNKAGLHTEFASDGFIIDDTSPIFVKIPQIKNGQGSIVPMTTISRTTLQITWDVIDNESYIARQYISMSSHQLGEFNSSLLELPGLLREFTFTNLELSDGCRYNIKITACNMAGLCTSSSTGGVLVDGSTPLTGTLAVKTDHASDLSRHESSGMTWNMTSLTLAWLGFADLHSGVDHYIVTVGSSVFDSDLTDNKLPTKVSHINGIEEEDEGVVQIFSVKTMDISSRKSVFVSVWAMNGVGLSSKPLLSELKLGTAGLLEIVKRCEAYDCEGNCVCSGNDQGCSHGSGCTILENGGTQSSLTVSDITNLRKSNIEKDEDFSPFDSFLAATWKTTNNLDQQQPLRYEISAGESQFNTPLGIFNTAMDRVWFDAGKRQSAVIGLEKGNYLELGETYSVFVRAWFDNITYSVFKSDGILIDNTGPALTSHHGRAVKENIDKIQEKDTDFQSFTDKIFVSWKEKFKQRKSGLAKYRVHICTLPGGHSIHSSEELTSVNYTAYALSLQPGTAYYSSVLAYSKAGVVNWAYSDGIQPDTTPPIAGHIRDGNGLMDLDYQSSTSDIYASWNGFSDIDSSIVKYYWCAGIVNDTTDCSIRDWQDMGLHTSGTAKLTSAIGDGTKVWMKVYAKDAVGHTSSVAVSDGIVIDSSAPKPTDTAYLGNNLVLNPSFEADMGNIVSENVTCNLLLLSSWEVGVNSCVNVLTSETPNAKDGANYVAVSGSLKQTIYGLVMGKRYSLTVHTGYPESLTLKHIAVDGNIGIGRVVFTFSLDPHLCKGICMTDEHSYILWSTHSFQFLAETASSDLIISTTSRHMEMVVDHVTLQEVDYAEGPRSMTRQHHFTVHPIFLPHWSSVHLMWHFADDHSPITDYKWAAGTVHEGTQIQNFVSAGRHNHATLSGLSLTHNQKLYLTILAKNAAGLTAVSHPDPITVDMTPPVFSYIHDGKGPDIDYQELGNVHVNWKIDDKESGIQRCHWAIGTSPGRTDIKKFKDLAGSQMSAQFKPDLTSPSLTVFTTVRCFNKVGLVASATTDGVTLMGSNYSTRMEGLKMKQMTMPYYPIRGSCLISETIRLHWARDDRHSTVAKVKDEISSYNVTIPSQYNFVRISGLHFKNLSNIIMEVFHDVINEVQGDTTYFNISFHGQPPAIRKSMTIVESRTGHRLSLSWAGLFSTTWNDLLFEVRVGTVKGSANILEDFMTRKYEIHLTLTSAHAGKSSIYVAVTAVDPCGYTRSHTRKINLT